MDGKVCVVTGATAGIGEVTARELARLGAEVVVVGRNPGRCAAAVERIRSAGVGGRAVPMVADLSRLAEVRRLAEEIAGRYETIDVLVNNAGAMFVERRITADGIEQTFALNHLAPFLLTNLLLDRLRAAPSSRVVVVSSRAHTFGRFRFEDVPVPARYSGFRAYSQSKLANILFTRELASRLDGSGVTANALHPGFVASNFFAGPGAVRWLARRLAGAFAISPEEGAKTSVYVASSPELSGVSGRYFEQSREATPAPFARDDDTARRLWDLSESLVASPPEADGK